MKFMNFNKIVLTSTLLALGACGGGSDSGTNETSSLRVSLADAPVDGAEAVCVTITGIEVNSNDSGWEEYPFSIADVPDEYLCDPDDPIDETDSFSDHINLLSLTDGASIELLNEEVETGTYKVRLMLAEDNSEGAPEHYFVAEGDDSSIESNQQELFIPSGSQTGLKLDSLIVVAVNSPASYTIDFDVRKSVVLRGNPNNNNGYLLKPVLRLIDDNTAGSISGVVYETDGEPSAPTEVADGDFVVDFNSLENCTDEDPMTGNMVYVYEGNVDEADLGDLGSAAPPITTSYVELDDQSTSPTYSYTTALLTEGTYTIAFTCRADKDTSDEVETLDFQGVKVVTITANTSEDE